jgi:hypothetical protein
VGGGGPAYEALLRVARRTDALEFSASCCCRAGCAALGTCTRALAALRRCRLAAAPERTASRGAPRRCCAGRKSIDFPRRANRRRCGARRARGRAGPSRPPEARATRTRDVAGALQSPGAKGSAVGDRRLGRRRSRRVARARRLRRSRSREGSSRPLDGDRGCTRMGPTRSHRIVRRPLTRSEALVAEQIELLRPLAALGGAASRRAVNIARPPHEPARQAGPADPWCLRGHAAGRLVENLSARRAVRGYARSPTIGRAAFARAGRARAAPARCWSGARACSASRTGGRRARARAACAPPTPGYLEARRGRTLPPRRRGADAGGGSLAAAGARARATARGQAARLLSGLGYRPRTAAGDDASSGRPHTRPRPAPFLPAQAGDRWGLPCGRRCGATAGRGPSRAADLDAAHGRAWRTGARGAGPHAAASAGIAHTLVLAGPIVARASAASTTRRPRVLSGHAR